MKSEQLITERYHDQIRGELSCFDRIVVAGTLPDICHSAAMIARLGRENLHVSDYTTFVEPLRHHLANRASELARASGLEIEFIRKSKDFRKEKRIDAILKKRGDHPGLVHVFSAMENCSCFKPRYDRQMNKIVLTASVGRCLHYYFYFIDEILGLLHVRVPTWAPFRLQVCLNGHNWLASRLRQSGVAFEMNDNAFVKIADFSKARELADELDAETLHWRLNYYANLTCAFDRALFPHGWHWSLSQVEYATDVVFSKPTDLAPLYESLVTRAIQQVKANDIATFLGHNGLSPNYEGEGGTRYNLTVEGTRIRHTLGKASIKMYDKFNHILRVETTCNDVSIFKHHRPVEHRDGSVSLQNASVKKTIHSLGAVRKLLMASNRRYLEFISRLDDDSQGRKTLAKITKPVVDDKGRAQRGVNFFREEDLKLTLTALCPEHFISGMTARRLRSLLNWTSAKISRAIRRLRLHGLLKKVAGTHKYYLTKRGQSVFATATRIRELEIIPALS